jgi:hypothetical protein
MLMRFTCLVLCAESGSIKSRSRSFRKLFSVLGLNLALEGYANCCQASLILVNAGLTPTLHAAKIAFYWIYRTKNLYMT